MKINKLFRKLTAAALSAVLISTAAVPAFAVTPQPKGYIVDSVREGSVDYQKNNADMLYDVFLQILDYKTKIDIRSYHIPYDSLNYQEIYYALQGIFTELFYFEFDTLESPTYFYDATTDGFCIKELSLNYGKSEEQVKAMLDAFHEKADYYLSLIDDSMDNFTKAVVLHDALVLNSRYQIKSPGSSVVDSTAYTLMVDGWGRCENYAEVYAYLLAHAGIKSEIINSDSMSHEWLKIDLDGSGKYYNVDITWDDPLTRNSDRPGRAVHSYFLLSDEMNQDSDHNHYDYIYTNASDSAYDGMENLHSIKHPFFYIDGVLYTLYRTDSQGIIAAYNHNNDALTDLYTINDRWYTSSGGWWMSNHSDIGMYQGLLYFNRENSVDIYNPQTGKVENYISNALKDGRQLYGMYIRDGVIYGLAANNPNEDPESVELAPCRENQPQYKKGDVNLDGVVNINDATAIQRFLAELDDLSAQQKALADFNGDGDVDISDATDIQIAISR